MSGPSYSYAEGTLSVLQGATTVTGVGTAWSTTIKGGDEVHAKVGTAWVFVGLVDGTTTIGDLTFELQDAFPGASISGATYRIKRGIAWLSGAAVSETLSKFLTDLGPLGLAGSSASAGIPAAGEGRENQIHIDGNLDIYQKRSGVWVRLAGSKARVEFHALDYVPANQVRHIINKDSASQNASAVAAGLQTMHQAMMDAVVAAGSADIHVTGVYRGRFAVNDELFSETFAQKLWDITNVTNGRFIFDMKGAEFHAKGWPSHKAVRTSGWYAARTITDPVPMAMFRWEQKTKRALGPYILGGKLKGEFAITDPIGMKLRNVNSGAQENVEIGDFLNVGRWIDDINNSIIDGSVIRRCGFQPTQAGGNGFTSTTLTASTTAGTGTSTVTTNEAAFTADHVGKWVMIEGAGEAGTVFCAKITSVTSTTAAAVDKQCTTNVVGKKLSFVMIAGSTTANSTTLTLDTEVTIDLVGRYVMVWKAGSKVHPEEDVLVTRVTAQAADNKTLTLATAARSTVSNVPVCVAPSRFLGKCDDQVTEAGAAEVGHNNDTQFLGERIEFSFDHTWGSAIPSVEQFVLNCQFFGQKLHGTSPDYTNFGANGMDRWQDNCKYSNEPGSQFEWGSWHPEYGKLCFSGARTCVFLPDSSFGDVTPADHTAIVYLHPQTNDVGDCRVARSGFLNTLPTRWNLTNQRNVRLGATGNADMDTALGPLVSRDKAGYPDMPSLHAGRVELFHDTPAIYFRDLNGSTRYRITMNGGLLSFDRDLDNNGAYEDAMFSLTTADASFKKDIRAQTGVLRSSQSATIADGAATTITPPATGVFTLWSNLAGVGALVFYRAELGPIVILEQTGVNTTVVTSTTLTGTTGVLGDVTIAINDGAIMIENRRGFTATVQWSFEAA